MDREREDYDDEPGRRRGVPVGRIVVGVVVGLVVLVVGARFVARIVAGRFMEWN